MRVLQSVEAGDDPMTSRLVTWIYISSGPCFFALAASEVFRHQRTATMHMGIGVAFSVLALLRIVRPEGFTLWNDPSQRAIQPPFLGRAKTHSDDGCDV